MTEFELFRALRPFYPSREYALLPQVANATGLDTNRHCDALALSLWPSRGLYLAGFEIKSYRGDWIRELKNPEKAEEIARYCNYWWIVAGNRTIVTVDELPPQWGLMAWDEKKGLLVKVKAAPFRKAVKPDLSFLAGVLRKAQEVLTPDAALAEARAESLKKGLAEGEARCKCELKQYADLQRKVHEYEKASGLKIAVGWAYPRDVGEAVNQVLQGTVERGRSDLRRIAEQILRDIDGPSDTVPRRQRFAAGGGA